MKFSTTILALGIGSSILFTACQSGQQDKLPFLGRKSVAANGNTTDTLYHTIPDFSFTNQKGEEITPEDFKDKIYVADFFFTTCPSICPVMKTQMLRVYEAYKGNEKVAILSHTIDPKHDTVEVLKDFAERLGVTGTQWNFVTGDKKEIYKIAQESYMVSALEDEDAPGGIVHSGHFLLIDSKRRVRGAYDGTDEESVDKLIKDIHILLNEEAE